MFTVDYILLAIIVLFALWGLKRGFLASLGSVLGIAAAVVVASRFYPQASSWLGGSNVSNVIAFVVIFSLTVKIISVAFWLVGKIFRIITVLPLIGSFDRFLGIIFGLAGGIFSAAVIVYFVLKFPFSSWLTEQLSHSVVSETLIKISGIFLPLLPDALK